MKGESSKAREKNKARLKHEDKQENMKIYETQANMLNTQASKKGQNSTQAKTFVFCSNRQDRKKGRKTRNRVDGQEEKQNRKQQKRKREKNT